MRNCHGVYMQLEVHSTLFILAVATGVCSATGTSVSSSLLNEIPSSIARMSLLFTFDVIRVCLEVDVDTVLLCGDVMLFRGDVTLFCSDVTWLFIEAVVLVFCAFWVGIDNKVLSGCCLGFSSASKSVTMIGLFGSAKARVSKSRISRESSSSSLTSLKSVESVGLLARANWLVPTLHVKQMSCSPLQISNLF